MKNKQEQEKLDNLRHSSAHLLAAAVLEIWPDTKHSIGPSIENGFYYDFDFGEEKVSDGDLKPIEKKMRNLVKNWDKFEGNNVSDSEAKKQFTHNQYKHELIDELQNNKEAISLYKSGNFIDLCRGGHVDNPKEELKHFKLLSVAGAYWRGDEKNKMLTRIYGTAFFNEEELDQHLKMLEEAKKRDHKKLGVELDLFAFTEAVGKGLPLWTPKGSVIRRELERFIIDEETSRGYEHVYTPDIANLKLYEKSGHYPYYKESMYAPIDIEDDKFMLRPMTCPHHFELFNSRPRSYKDLPMRIAEVSRLYRYEKSGELMGLLRVRAFSLTDAHIVCRKSQAKDEINRVFDLIEYISDIFGLKMGEHYHYRLSLGNRQDDKKYFKDDESWDFAEEVLRSVLLERKSIFVEAEDEAAFYGPKVDVQMKNVNGKEDTAFTNQYDFVMPKRFDMKFTNEDGTEEEPVVIHRASLGAIERTVAFLIEHFAGAFPTWLAPIQAVVIPIAESHQGYADSIHKSLKQSGVRSEVNKEAQSMQKKIRIAEKQKIPYMLIVGDKEKESNSVSVRKRGQKDLGNQGQQKFVSHIVEEIESKSLDKNI
ncbi:threonine--tRNA ligase [Patescibacteria group bacterium]